MATLHLLGTGAALSDPHRTTTMLAVHDGISTIVVDCGGDVIQRILAAGLSIESIDALIITHEHPDHVSGFPLFMEKVWLSGRRRPIRIHGIRQAIEQARRCFIAFDTSSWDTMPPIDWQEIPFEENARVLENESWIVNATPATHSVPTVGLRFKSLVSGGVVAYSCDTEPSEKIATMAREADILVHEATGEGPGHSSCRQAARIASEAGAGRLLLVHLPPSLPETEVDAAREIFYFTEVGEENGAYEF